MAQAQYAGTGRRKNAVARVRLVPGTGKITVNKKDVEEYIPHADLRLIINQPLQLHQLKVHTTFSLTLLVVVTVDNQVRSVMVSLVRFFK